MRRPAAIALLLLLGLAAPAAAQTFSPSATPTGGDVGSATMRNGFPASGGAVALPRAATPTTGTATPAAGTTAPAGTAFSITPTTGGTGNTTNSANGLGAAGLSGAAGGASTGGGFSANGVGSGSRGGAAATSSGGAASTAGAATATRTGTGGNFVLCPPSGASGLSPLLIGTDLSCAPQ